MAELDDFEQEEQIKRWIKQNVPWIIGGVIVGLAGIFGYRHWESSQLEKTAIASDLYDNIVQAYREGNAVEVEELMSRLQQDHAGGSYELFGALFLAKQQADQQQFGAAIDTLQKVMPIAEQANFADMLRTRIARLHLANGAATDAVALLNQNKSRAFQAISQELIGDAYFAQDNIPQAQEAYRSALVSSRQPSPMLLQKNSRAEQVSLNQEDSSTMTIASGGNQSTDTKTVNPEAADTSTVTTNSVVVESSSSSTVN